MRNKLGWIWLVVLLAVLVPSVAMAAGPRDLQSPDGKIVLGGTYTLSAGQSLDGGLAVIGGIATLEAGSTVNGDVAVIGGVLMANGAIQGDLAGIGATMSLGPQSVVNGDLGSIGAEVSRAEGSVVTGQVNSGVIFGGPIESGAIVIPGFSGIPRVEIPGLPDGQALGNLQNSLPMRPDFGGIFDRWPMQAVWFLGRTLLLAGLAMVAMLFLERPISRIAQASVDSPSAAGGIGCLTAIIVPLILVFLLLTICLIPVSVLGWIVFYLARTAGWIALGLEVGRRMGQSFRWNLQPPVAAGLGTLVLTLVVDGLGLIPCIGVVLRVLVATLGLGAVVLTRFGSREYLRPAAALAPTPAAPPEPLPPPS